MTKDDKSTKDKILLATVEGMEKYGVDRLTIRNIAREAGVNSAAISYHFGSRDKLIKMALKRTLYTAFAENLEQFPHSGPDPYANLKGLFLELLGGARRYPGVTKAHFYGPFVKNRYSADVVREFGEFLDELVKRLKSLGFKRTRKEFEMTLTQMMSAILLPGLMPELFSGFAEINFDKPGDQRKYINFLFKRFLS